MVINAYFLVNGSLISVYAPSQNLQQPGFQQSVSISDDAMTIVINARRAD
ncbi:MAG: hypothetical protein RLP44_12845 [Aggregatilineales bacterium]